MDYSKDVPNSGRLNVTPPLLLPGQLVLYGAPPPSPSPGTRFLQARSPRGPSEKCDPEWVWPRCSDKGPGGPVRALGARIPGSRPARKVLTGIQRLGPRSPYSLPQRGLAQGSVLPGPRKEETHFRRVHDLPRLLLTLAAGAGAGHLGNWTTQRTPPSLAGFRRAGQRGFSLPQSQNPPCPPVSAHALGILVEGRLRKDRENRSSLEIPKCCKADGCAPTSLFFPRPYGCLPGVKRESPGIIVSRD